MKAVPFALCLALLLAVAAAYESHSGEASGGVVLSAAQENGSANAPALSRARESLRETRINASEKAKELRESARQLRSDVAERAKEMRGKIREAWKEKKDEAKIVAYDVAIERASIEMNATIAALTAMGVNTSSLEALSDEFLALSVELQNATDVDEVVKELRDNLREFRREARELAGNRRTELEQNISGELATREKVIGELRNMTCQHLRNVSLKVFDKQVRDAGHVLDVMENNTKLNVSALRTKLDGIKTMRPMLEEAYASCNRSRISDAAKKINDAWQELRRLHAQLVREQAHAKIIERLEGLVEKVERVLARARATGVDTSPLDADLAQLNATVEKARADYAAGDSEAVKADLEDAKEAFKVLRDGLKELLRSVEE